MHTVKHIVISQIDLPGFLLFLKIRSLPIMWAGVVKDTLKLTSYCCYFGICEKEWQIVLMQCVRCFPCHFAIKHPWYFTSPQFPTESMLGFSKHLFKCIIFPLQYHTLETKRLHSSQSFLCGFIALPVLAQNSRAFLVRLYITTFWSRCLNYSTSFINF